MRRLRNEKEQAPVLVHRKGSFNRLLAAAMAVVCMMVVVGCTGGQSYDIGSIDVPKEDEQASSKDGRSSSGDEEDSGALEEKVLSSMGLGETPSGAASEEEPKADGPVTTPTKCTIQSALGPIKRITAGHEFNAQGYAEVLEEMRMCSVEIDEASIRAPFDEYDGLYNDIQWGRALIALNTKYNDYYRAADDPETYKIDITVKRGVVNYSKGDVPERSRANARNNLSTTDDRRYYTTVSYTLVIEEGKGKLVCDTPDWWKEG